MAINTTFDRYPSIEIVADPYSPQYRVKYIECIKDHGTIRFEKHERMVPREELERIVLEIIGKNE